MKPRAPSADLLSGTRSHGWDLCEAVYDAAITKHRTWPGTVVPGAITADGRFNPLWWEWLMGFPLNWTACTPLGTP